MAANAQIVFTPEGKRLYGMDADLYLKEQASRDLEFEGKMVDVGGQAVNKPATVSKKDEDDLEERLRKLQEL